jgi:hypothetical protein
MEAFSDGVFAVIITIMVLELKSPQGTNLAALKPMVPVFFSYVLSFVYVGIYWNNHHHLLQAAQHVAGAVRSCLRRPFQHHNFSACFVLLHAAVRLNDFIELKGFADLDVQCARRDLLNKILNRYPHGRTDSRRGGPEVIAGSFIT